MSDEKFKRSEIGHNANDLHKHGGLDGAHEEKTERESLEEAIEELNDSEETENLEKIEKDMDGEIETEDIEEIDEKVSEPAIETPSQQMSDEEIDEKVAEVLKEHAAEPENGWKTKAENQPYMTIDTVEEPKAKKKGGAGWKFATVFFLLLAVAGCGAAAYLFFNDGKTEFMGRTVVSQSKEEAKVENTAKDPNNAEIADKAAGSRYIYLDGYDYALKIPDTLTNVSFRYDRFNFSNSFDANYSNLYTNASTKKEGAQATPAFVGNDLSGNFQNLGGISIANSEWKGDLGSAPDLAFKLDNKYYVYYYHPQHAISQDPIEQKWEMETIDAIEAWLEDEKNYIKLN